MRKAAISISILYVSLCSLFSQEKAKTNFPLLKGPYLGQKPPGSVAEIFAPGIISVGGNNHSHPAFSSDGREMFWSVYSHEYNEGNLFYHMKEVNGQWIQPVMSEDSKIYDDGSPFFSNDGNRVYFFSDRPTPESDSSWRIQMDFNIWYLQKEGTEWSEPQWLSTLPNTKEYWEFELCQTKDGSIYYTRSNITNERSPFGIVKSKFKNGKYQKPEVLGDQFNDGNRNRSVYVDPNETYMIFSSNRGNPSAGQAGQDLYISYRKPGGDWTGPINMGANINTKETVERFPYVSPNGKYLFFVRGYGDIYWVNAKIIEELRPTELK